MTHEREPVESEIWLPPSVPFYFDPERMNFVVGFSGSEERIAPKDIKDIWDIGQKTYEKTKDMSPSAPETLIMPNLPIPIIMASARKPLLEIVNNSSTREEIGQKVNHVLRTVYHEAALDIPLPRLNKQQDIWSFGVSFFQDGKFTVRTFGNCACMGPNPTPTFLDTESIYSPSYNAFPFELTLHNADSRAQRLSLLAGAGTIGWITKQMGKI